MVIVVLDGFNSFCARGGVSNGMQIIQFSGLCIHVFKAAAGLIKPFYCCIKLKGITTINSQLLGNPLISESNKP